MPSAQFLPRRSILGAAALSAPFLVRRPARAAAKEVVLMMSGGSFMTNWQTKIIDPFQKQTGLKVRMLPGNGKAQALTLATRPTEPQFDVYLGGGDDFLKLAGAGLMRPVTAAIVPNLAKLYPKFLEPWGGHGAHFDYSSVGIAYRADRIKQPPRSWREFIDRTASGEFGQSVFLNAMGAGVRGPEVLVTISRALTGNVEDVDAGFAALKRMKPYVFKWFSGFNDPVVLLLNDEGSIGTGWDGRTFVAHDESNGAVDWIAPTEGAASSGPAIGVVKGGNEEGALALMDYALGAEAQKAFCEAMFYGSPNADVRYSEVLAKRIPPADSVVVPDDRLLSKNLSAWVERWNREIAS